MSNLTLRSIVLAVALVIVPSAAAAQVTQTDYVRAAGLSSAFGGLITGIVDAPVWLDDAEPLRDAPPGMAPRWPGLHGRVQRARARSLRVIEVHGTTGAARALVDERSDTFIHYSGRRSMAAACSIMTR